MSNPFESIELKLDHLEDLIQSLKNQKSEPEKVSYLTRQEAAELLHITLPTLWDWTRTGKVKGHRIGARVLYLADEIRQAVKEIATIKYAR